MDLVNQGHVYRLGLHAVAQVNVAPMAAVLINMKYLLSIVLSMFLLSCEFSATSNRTIDNIPVIRSNAATVMDNILLDSLSLKISNYSADGFCIMVKDSLYLADRIFSTISTFTLAGKFKRQFLGKKSIYNLQSLNSLSVIDDGSFIISDKFKFLKFTKNWNFADSSFLIYPKTTDNDVLLDKPIGKYPDLYEIKYNRNSYPNKGRYILVEVDSEHPKFNGFTTENYYTSARNLALVDSKTWQVKPIFGSWPKIYRLGKNYPYFANINYRYADRKFYLNYELDSLIYVFDKRYVPQYAFGVGGILNKSYAPSVSIASAYDEVLRISERKNRGYYDEIFVEPDKGLFLEVIFQVLRGR